MPNSSTSVGINSSKLVEALNLSADEMVKQFIKEPTEEHYLLARMCTCHGATMANRNTIEALNKQLSK